MSERGKKQTNKPYIPSSIFTKREQGVQLLKTVQESYEVLPTNLSFKLLYLSFLLTVFLNICLWYVNYISPVDRDPVYTLPQV